MSSKGLPVPPPEAFVKPGVMKADFEIDGVHFGPPFFREGVEKMCQFQFDPKDVIIAGYAKTGSTWLTEILRRIQPGPGGVMVDRVPLAEVTLPKQKSCAEMLACSEAPRLLFTHLPYSFLQKSLTEAKPRVLYLTRNPKDVLVSFWNFYKISARPVETFDEFFELFKNNEMLFGDYFEHTKGWWPVKNDENVLFLTYEKMKLQPFENIRNIAKFLGQDLTDAQVDEIVEQTSFKKMKAELGPKHATGSGFFRKGTVGDWQNTLSKEQSDYIDKRFDEELKSLGVEFIYE